MRLGGRMGGGGSNLAATLHAVSGNKGSIARSAMRMGSGIGHEASFRGNVPASKTNGGSSVIEPGLWR